MGVAQCKRGRGRKTLRARKKRAYEERIREVEHASFTALVLSANGGWGKEATSFYKRLASILSEKWDQAWIINTYVDGKRPIQ